MQNVFNVFRASILHFLFCLLLFLNGNSWKKIENYRKEGSDDTAVCVLPLSPCPDHCLSFFFTLPPNLYSLQCKQKLCHRHTCSTPGAARRERVYPQSSCTIQGLLPVLILSPQCNFTSLLCLQEFSELCSHKDHRMNSYLRALKPWFSSAMWPVVPHQGMIQHEETPGFNKKQAIRGAHFIATLLLILIRTLPQLQGQHWIYRGYAAQIIPNLWGYFYIIYQMCTIYSGSRGKSA